MLKFKIKKSQGLCPQFPREFEGLADKVECQKKPQSQIWHLAGAMYLLLLALLKLKTSENHDRQGESTLTARPFP